MTPRNPTNATESVPDMTITTSQPRRGALPLPTPPTGWPVGSYPTYAKALQAVDSLAVDNFPVADVSIVGVDLVQVERVTGRLNWQKVISGGLVSGARLGVFIALAFGLFTGHYPQAIAVGMTLGIAFGLVSTVIPYAATKGQRAFSSTLQLVAGRYDVLCQSTTAERARDTLARLAIT